eukprot:4498106-Amphidinium_carterae.5
MLMVGIDTQVDVDEMMSDVVLSVDEPNTTGVRHGSTVVLALRVDEILLLDVDVESSANDGAIVDTVVDELHAEPLLAAGGVSDVLGKDGRILLTRLDVEGCNLHLSLGLHLRLLSPHRVVIHVHNAMVAQSAVHVHGALVIMQLAMDMMVNCIVH